MFRWITPSSAPADLLIADAVLGLGAELTAGFNRIGLADWGTPTRNSPSRM